MAARLRLLPALLSLAALLGCDGGEPAPTEPPGPVIPVGKAPRKSPPMNPVGGFSIQLPKVTLKPGDERSPCFIFPLDLKGPSHFVGGASLTVGAGMHHGNITSRPKTGEGIRPCPKDEGGLAGEAVDIAKGGAVLFGSSTQISGTEWQSFPEGMAYRSGIL